MDGENNGKPYEQMDDLGVFPYFWKHPALLNGYLGVHISIIGAHVVRPIRGASEILVNYPIISRVSHSVYLDYIPFTTRATLLYELNKGITF